MSSTLIANTGLNHPNEMFIQGPNFVNALSMTLASSAANVPLISGAHYVRLAGNEDMFVLFGSTGVATAATTAGTGSEYVAKGSGGILRAIGGGTTAISVISTAAACTVTASWWTI